MQNGVNICVTDFHAFIRTRYIERAGLQERNVECCTFDGLCKKLLERNGLFLPGGVNAIEARRQAVMTAFSNGKIKDRYYVPCI